MKKHDGGFTLIEMVVTVAIITILLGLLSLSLNSILGFRVQRAVNSIGAALDKTKVEAMSRLVGEMKLEKTSDGYYISYYFHRGGEKEIREENREKIAPGRIQISYKVQGDGNEIPMKEGDSLILTFDRDTGGFRPLQEDIINGPSMWKALKEQNQDVDFLDREPKAFCTEIIVKGGSRTRTVQLDIATGNHSIYAG